ncbi:MAG: replication-associated recombination protein A [Arenicellales bacterium]|nr:replication-associated recombination protein A [Arenicellales bacterium]
MTSVGSQDFRPLADRMRPQSIDQIYGQDHILGTGKPLRRALEGGILHSMVLWGPPGSGKTTLARLLAQRVDAHFLSLSAVLSGVKDIREAIEKAKLHRQQQNRATVLFVDEAHRFNKAQQDAFLPHVEQGVITFIGATTENPSFELNNALLSRTRVYVLKPLDQGSIRRLIDSALTHSQGYADTKLDLPESYRDQIAAAADGDARRALNTLEIVVDLAPSENDVINVTQAIVNNVLTEGLRRFDKSGEAFYDQISALHKSVRGSNPDAALYWFVRMIDGGCDPRYVARRVIRIASEDIGNADPRALTIALDAWNAYERLGTPEGELAIAQAIIYLSCAAKSNAVYTAFERASEDVKKLGSLEVPLHLRNAPTKLMKELNYGKRYRYAHDEPEAYAAGENYFPDGMANRKYYHPVARGLEQKIAEKLAHLKDLDTNVPIAKDD